MEIDDINNLFSLVQWEAFDRMMKRRQQEYLNWLSVTGRMYLHHDWLVDPDLQLPEGI